MVSLVIIYFLLFELDRSQLNAIKLMTLGPNLQKGKTGVKPVPDVAYAKNVCLSAFNVDCGRINLSRHSAGAADNHIISVG